MMTFQLMLRAEDDEPLYFRSLAARMAHVSLDFLILCEREGLIKERAMTGGGTGYTIRTIRQLSRIHRLHHDLELDLETIDLVLHLRGQIVDLQARLEQVEKRARQREQQLLVELRELRQVLERKR